MKRADSAVHLDTPPRETPRDHSASTVKHLLPAILAELGFQSFNEQKYLRLMIDAGAFWRRRVRKKGIPPTSEKHYALAVEYLDGDHNRGQMFWKPPPLSLPTMLRSNRLEYPRDGERLRQAMTALFHQFTCLNIDMMRPEPISPFNFGRPVTMKSGEESDDDTPLKYKSAFKPSTPVKVEQGNTPSSHRPDPTPRSATLSTKYYTPRAEIGNVSTLLNQTPATISSFGIKATPATPETPTQAARHTQRPPKANSTPRRPSKAKASLGVAKKTRTPPKRRKMILGQDRHAQRESPSCMTDMAYQASSSMGDLSTMSATRPRRTPRQTVQPDGYMDWKMAEDRAGGEQGLFPRFATPPPVDPNPLPSTEGPDGRAHTQGSRDAVTVDGPTIESEKNMNYVDYDSPCVFDESRVLNNAVYRLHQGGRRSLG